MDEIYQALGGAIFAFLSGVAGYWGYLKSRRQKKDTAQDAMIQLLMGLAQERILELGMRYIERGWMTPEEHQDLLKYLCKPYIALGGNGTVERVMHGVERVPMRNTHDSILGHVWNNIEIREEDPTGLPSGKDNYKGEDRRGRDQ